MKIQRILYNQLNKTYLYDDIDRFLLVHTVWDIRTWTSAWKLSLNVYSKLVAYAWGKGFIQNMQNAEFIVSQSWFVGIIESCKQYNCTDVVVMDSCESYVSDTLYTIKKRLSHEWITMDIRPNTQFLISHQEFKEEFKKPPVMESFYRWMRKKARILMDWEKPEWWQRNYDKENRKFDRNFDDVEHLRFHSVYRKEACEFYAQEIKNRWHQPQAYIPVTREESIQLLGYFVTHHLDRFGELEDAMYTTSDFVYHSLLSIPINFGLLTPWEVIQAVEKADTAINNKEWFIRQVLWWREYMYHRFNHYKDDIYEQNFFGYHQELPERFWRPEQAPSPIKKMKCVSHVLEKVEKLWYSHHIERLMIVGNFCLLVWYNPHSVNKRFREQYADAFERVVTPNVLGMSQYADGWKLATKPYVASANYVKKMSNYCKGCQYDPKEKYGENACPLNYLYWNFIEKNKEVFVTWRQSFIVNHLKKIDIDTIQEQSDDFIWSIWCNEKDS